MENKINKNPWKRATFILAFCCVVVILFGSVLGIGDSVFGNKPNGYDSLEELMCKNIEGTPAWANYNGMILDYGFKNFDDDLMSVDKNLIIESLIEDKIYYLYNPNCIHCQKQEEWFGEEAYSKYKESGYTIDCTQYW